MRPTRIISGIPLRTRLAWLALAAAAGAVVGLWVASLGGPAALSGLAAPRGLTALDDGSLLIAEGAAGRILRWDLSGDPEVIAGGFPYLTASGIEGESASGVSAAIRTAPGVYHAVVGEARAKGHQELFRVRPPEPPMGVTGQDVLGVLPPNLLTNPYDLVTDGDGFLVSDAGRNEVLRIDAEGEVTTFAPLPFIDSPEGLVEPVPTGMVRGPGGTLYVATLTGWPHPQGAAGVYVVGSEGQASLYASGFNAATDLAFDADGTLLVTEFSMDMNALAQDLTADRAEALPGRLVRCCPGEIAVLADDLVSPTAVAVVGGRIFVSEEFAGRVREVGPEARGALWGLLAGLGAALGVGVLALLAGRVRTRSTRAA